MQQTPWLVVPLLALPLSLTPDGGPAEVLDKAPSKFAKSGDLKVHYKSLGEGKSAVVFIHGWCCDHSVWRAQATAFDGKVRMLFIDLPGYGKSDKPKIEYTMDVFAKGVDAALQDAGVDKAVLAGHSMGTPVVRQFYRLFPGKTKGLIFVDGPVRPIIEDPGEIEKFQSMFKEETFKDIAPTFLAAMFPPGSPVAVRKHIEVLVDSTSPQVAISSMRGMMDKKIWGNDQINVPCLALMAKSAMWNDDYKAFAKKLVPSLDYRKFDDVGHFLFMEKPNEINSAIGAFLKREGMVK